MAKEPKPSTEKSEEVAKPVSLKEYYADMFAAEKSKQTGKEFKGKPSIEESAGNPLLVKYAQNYLNACD